MTLDQEILDVLDEHGRMSRQKIERATYDGEARCSECGARHGGFIQHQKRVREAMRRLLYASKLVSTADWDYRLPT